MMKKLMFFAALVVMAMFASCSDTTEVVGGNDVAGKKVTLSINADLGGGSRIGFTPEGNALKASFQEGDFMMVYFRTASGGWCNKTTVLKYVPGSANGTKGTFAASDVVIPEDAGLLHILLGSEKGSIPYVDAAAGKASLTLDMRNQDGTLESAALNSVFQADPLMDGNMSYNADNTQATINNVTFVPKTAIVKIDATMPEGKVPEVGQNLEVVTESAYNSVTISGGNPGGASLPAGANGEVIYNVKVAEVSGQKATAYMLIWPNIKDDEFGIFSVKTVFNGKKIYTGDYMKAHEGKLEPGKVYSVPVDMTFTEATPEKLWVNDEAQTVVDGLEYGDEGATTAADWLSYSNGKITASANETGAPRIGVINLTDKEGDLIPYEITQVEPKDFKGQYTFTTKIFGGTGSYKSTLDPAQFDVEFVDARKGYTLTDADGETQHTNNIGIRGLYYDAIMDAAIEIDYKNRTAKMGVFFDARDGEGQAVTVGGASKFMTFVPALVTMNPNGAWTQSWKFDETELGDPDYTWAWFTISSDLKTILYRNVTNSKTQSFSVVPQYTALSVYAATQGMPMNNIAGIDVVLSNTNVFTHATVAGYANVYQTNPMITAGVNAPGNQFVRK